ncbi:MAG: hypothetical protein OEV94_12105 [Deltaproteobacteria bacterium]|nr:hypothetical protein [Deltaproteobacteria bacterium]
MSAIDQARRLEILMDAIRDSLASFTPDHRRGAALLLRDAAEELAYMIEHGGSEERARNLKREELNLEQVQAFAITDDHAAQEALLKDGAGLSLSPGRIREHLMEGKISATDRRVKYVGLKKYEAAGGKVRRDLFAAAGESDEGVIIEDAKLLDELAALKLEHTIKSLKGEGWKWCEARAEFGWGERSKYIRLYPIEQPLPPELGKEYDELSARLDELDADGEVSAEENKIRARLKEIEKQRPTPEFTTEQKALAGVVVTIDYNGKADILRGLVRHEDRKLAVKAENAQTQAGACADTQEGAGAKASGLPKALLQTLTTDKTAALAACLMKRHEIALAAVVHAFLLRGRGSPLRITAKDNSLGDDDNPYLPRAEQEIGDARREWHSTLMKHAGEFDSVTDIFNETKLWDWCISQSTETLLEVLALCAAVSMDAVAKNGQWEAVVQDQANRLGAALALDMRDWFTPTAENYYGKVNKSEILEALAAGVPTAFAARGGDWKKLPKAELAQVAERELKSTRWLPKILRGDNP